MTSQSSTQMLQTQGGNGAQGNVVSLHRISPGIDSVSSASQDQLGIPAFQAKSAVSVKARRHSLVLTNSNLPQIQEPAPIDSTRLNLPQTTTLDPISDREINKSNVDPQIIFRVLEKLNSLQRIKLQLNFKSLRAFKSLLFKQESIDINTPTTIMPFPRLLLISLLCEGFILVIGRSKNNHK